MIGFMYPDRPSRDSYDVIIVGGAMHGAAVAWFLASDPDFDGSLLVVERDPTYSFASTSHTNSCMRQQYSQEINIRVSQFGANYIKTFREQMGGDERVPEIVFQTFGYLYLAGDEARAKHLKAAQKLQAACGAGTRILERDELAAAFPFYNLEDILLGSHNTQDEGYFDGATVFDWWKRKGREAGAEYIANEVTTMTLSPSGKQVESVTLKTGETLGCGSVVNASGPRAKLTAAMAGIDLPVAPLKRHTWIFAAREPLGQTLPLTIDPSGLHVRSDGPYYMCGCPPDEDPPTDYDDFEEDHGLWEAKVWPLLAHRIPAFEAIKLVNSWVGHYAFNAFDQNAIVGPHPEVANFFFTNGYSGHGLQQAPAIGKGLAERILHGAYRTLDLTPFGYDRILENRPFVEAAVI